MSESVDLALVAMRALTYGLGVFVFGRSSFAALVTKVAAARDLAGRLLAAGLSAAAVGYLLLLAREVGALDAGGVVQLVAGTGFGRALAVSGVAAAALAAAPADRLRVRLALAGVALGALAFVGHAADGTGPRGALRLAMMAGHLLAVGAWIGALPSLWVALRGRDADAARTLSRFGQVAGLALAVVLGTGLVSLTFVVVDARGMLGPTYLRTLGIKLAFVAGLLTLAVANRFALAPRVATAPARVLAALRVTILTEQALGLAAIATVAVLGQLDPTM